jgi:hypothetical protein
VQQNKSSSIDAIQMNGHKQMSSPSAYLDSFLRPCQLDALGLCFAAVLQEAQRGPRHPGGVRVQLQPVQLPDHCKNTEGSADTMAEMSAQTEDQGPVCLGFEVQSSLCKRKRQPVPFLKFVVRLQLVQLPYHCTERTTKRSAQTEGQVWVMSVPEPKPSHEARSGLHQSGFSCSPASDLSHNGKENASDEGPRLIHKL